MQLTSKPKCKANWISEKQPMQKFLCQYFQNEQILKFSFDAIIDIVILVFSCFKIIQ